MKVRYFVEKNTTSIWRKVGKKMEFGSMDNLHNREWSTSIFRSIREFPKGRIREVTMEELALLF